jgi:hypothetical protein
VALLLRAKGITKVRPLEGGIDAWLGVNFDTLPKASSRNRFSSERASSAAAWCRQKSVVSKYKI